MVSLLSPRQALVIQVILLSTYCLMYIVESCNKFSFHVLSVAN
jgi:hypothetical protein